MHRWIKAVCGLALFGASLVAAEEASPILLSRPLMELEGLQVGDLVRLSPYADGREAQSFQILGSYEPLPDPMRLTRERFEARLHLGDLIRLSPDSSDPAILESVDSINVKLSESASGGSDLTALGHQLPGLAIIPTSNPDGFNPFVVLKQFHSAIAIITVIGSTAFLLALMVMRADERRETVGILRLLGLSKKRVLLEVFIEGLMLALGGALLGVVLAILAQAGFNRFFQWRYDTALIFVRVTPGTALRCLAISVPMGVFASVVASWRLLRLGVLELIRR